MTQGPSRSHTKIATTHVIDLATLLPPNWPHDQPLARIWTCGPLTVEILQSVHPSSATPEEGTFLYRPLSAPLFSKRGRSSATILLTLLASQPSGYAAKDFLSEHLRQGRGSNTLDEDEEMWETGIRRVDNIVSILRHLLCPPGTPDPKALGRLLVAHVPASQASGSGYRLAGTPLLWLDVEAIHTAIKAARAFEQAGQDTAALEQWQQAYDLLARGPFGDQEPYSDWACARRQELEVHQWACVQALSHNYLACGEAGETKALWLLQDYWQTHVAQEDARRLLLELLAKRECFGQAEKAYEQCCQALENEGKRPDYRTIAMMEAVRRTQSQRVPLLEGDQEQHLPAVKPVLLQPPPRRDFASHIARDIIQERVVLQPVPTESSALTNIFDRATQFTVTVFGLVNQWHGRATHCNDLQVLLSQEFAMFEQDALQSHGGDQNALSRRQALIAIAALPYGALAAARHAGTTLQPEAFLPQCTAAITSCWSMMRGREFAVVEQALAHCLPFQPLLNNRRLISDLRQVSRHKEISCLAWWHFISSQHPRAFGSNYSTPSKLWSRQQK